MKVTVVNMIFRIIFIVLSILSFLVFFAPTRIGIINVGNGVGMLLSLTIFFSALFWPHIVRFARHLAAFRWGKRALILFIIILCASCIWSIVLSALMARQALSKPDAPTTVIILGCKVNGEVPSLALMRRIDAAADYLLEHPDVMVIASGGQGPGEWISEAEAIRRRLESRGVDPERILLEDQSTSTYENLSFSKALLEEYDLGNDIIIVSEDYHLFRATRFANRLELNAQTLPAHGRLYLLPTFWVREWFALTAMLIQS